MEALIVIGLTVLFLWVTSNYSGNTPTAREDKKTDKLVGGIKMTIFAVFIILGFLVIALMLAGG